MLFIKQSGTEAKWNLTNVTRFIPSVADPGPGSGAFLTPGWVKNQHLDPGSGSAKNNPDHISESLEIFFGLKYFISLMRIRDGKKFGSGMEKSISGINIPDPQHCLYRFLNNKKVLQKFEVL
jgi:hypothetical protein